MKKSLAYPIIGLIFLVALSATSLSYYVSAFSLKKAVEEHEAIDRYRPKTKEKVDTTKKFMLKRLALKDDASK